MNRQIKFRVYYPKGYGSKMSYFTLGDSSYPSNVMQFPVMQYTGLKDRNGKEIYEGDILDCGEYHGIKEVVFMNGSYKIRGKMGQMVGFGSWANKTKVIGNIHENPELL